MRDSSATWGQSSDVGRVRELNEDYSIVQAIARIDTRGGGTSLFAVVADGMGGHSAGEVASQLAVETLVGSLRAGLSEGSMVAEELLDAIKDGFGAANQAVYERSQQNPDHAGMGTTLTAALLADGLLVAGHVGDSRLYLVRRGRVQKLTRDQSCGPRVLTEAIGIEPEARGQFLVRALRRSDALLLATDGAYASLTGDDLLHAVETNASPQAVCDDLVARARVRDGADNLTVVCLAPDGVGGTRKTPRGRVLLKWALGLVLVLIAMVALQIVRSSRYYEPERTPASGRPSNAGTSVLPIDVELRLTGGQVVAAYEGAAPLWVAVSQVGPHRVMPRRQAGQSGKATVEFALPSGRRSGLDQRVTLRVELDAAGKARWTFGRYPNPTLDELPKPLRHLWLDDERVFLDPYQRVPATKACPEEGELWRATHGWPVGTVRLNLAGNGQKGLPVQLAFGQERPRARAPELTEGAAIGRASESREAMPWSERASRIGNGTRRTESKERRPEGQTSNDARAVR
jgi:protein phosphatase